MTHPDPPRTADAADRTGDAIADPTAASIASTRADWRLRARLFAQRFWQPTSACLTCMPGSLANVASAAHWQLALKTGLLTGALVLILSFTPLLRAFRDRHRNAVLVGCLTAIGDAYSHANHYDVPLAEPIVTGIVSGAFAWIASWLLEDRARRVRGAWARVFGHAP